MTEVCFSEYARCLQKSLQPPNDDLSTVTLLLEWITDRSDVKDKKGNPINIDSSLTSNLLNRKVNVPKPIKDVCSNSQILVDSTNHFRLKVLPCLNPIMSDDMFEEMEKAIENDTSVSKRTKAKLLKLIDSGQEAEFLANLFMYVVNVENRKSGEVAVRDDIPLLAEVDFQCPICHRRLIEQVKANTIKKYDIVHIYPKIIIDVDLETSKPKNLDDHSNLIALCRDHAEEYLLSVTKEAYQELKQIKHQASMLYTRRVDVNEAALDEEIREVLLGLTTIPSNTLLKELSMDALRLDQKILPNNTLLLNDETTRVLRYYHYIEGIFAAMEREGTGNFNLIASEIAVAFQKLNQGTLSQDEIVEELAKWIKNKSGVGDKNLRACHIVVAFFIQNCEVFDEISK